MTKQRKKLYLGFAIYFITVLCIAVFPPFVSFWNKLEPHILGLPFAQFTVISLALFFISGLLSWFILEGRLNKEESAKRQRGELLDY